MEIRKARHQDTNQIISLQSQIYRVDKVDPHAQESLARQLEDETCDVLVGVIDGPPSRAGEAGKIVATSTIYYIQVAVRNRPYALFEGLVVDESERGKGTGTAMLNEMIAVARKKNCYKIIFTSGADRTDAHKFYEKMGFKKWGLEFRLDL